MPKKHKSARFHRNKHTLQTMLWKRRRRNACSACLKYCSFSGSKRQKIQMILSSNSPKWELYPIQFWSTHPMFTQINRKIKIKHEKKVKYFFKSIRNATTFLVWLFHLKKATTTAQSNPFERKSPQKTSKFAHTLSRIIEANYNYNSNPNLIGCRFL